MYISTDRRMDGRTDRQTDRQTDIHYHCFGVPLCGMSHRWRQEGHLAKIFSHVPKSCTLCMSTAYIVALTSFKQQLS